MAVVVVHPVPTIDIKSAAVYGDFQYVNRRYVYPDEISPEGAIPDDVFRNLAVTATVFNRERDYLLIAGDHLQIVTLAAMLGPPFKVLRYDRKAEGYLPITIGGNR